MFLSLEKILLLTIFFWLLDYWSGESEIKTFHVELNSHIFKAAAENLSLSIREKNQCEND